MSTGKNPRQYLGVRAITPPNLTVHSFAPNQYNYDGFEVGDWWLVLNEALYYLQSKSEGLSSWIQVEPGSSFANEYVTNSGTAIPVLNILNILGDGTTIVTTATGNTITISALETGLISSLTGNTGGAATPTANNINIVGDGTTATVAKTGTSTLTISAIIPTPPAPFVTWVDVTGTSQAMAVNTGYTADNSGLVTLTLPSTAVYGSIFYIVGKGAGGWKVAQNSGQTIHFGKVNTTTGTGGFLSSTLQYDTVFLLCSIANTDFTVLQSLGNITYN